MITIRPTGHLVLVKLKKFEERTASGLYIPDTARDVHQKAATSGTLVAVGPQAWKAFGDGQPWAEVGDVVVFPRYSGVTVDAELAGEEDLVLMNDEDCKGVADVVCPSTASDISRTWVTENLS
jgi:chaperonin GroES